MSPTGFINNTTEVNLESVTAIIAALLVVFAAIMDPYVSFGIAVILLTAIGLYRFVRRYKREQGSLNS